MTSTASRESPTTLEEARLPHDHAARLLAVADGLCAVGQLRTGERAGPVFLAGATAGLRLLAEGPWLSWLPFTFLARLPELELKPLPLAFGRRRYRAGLVARRAAEDLAPMRLLEDLVRDIELERLG